MASLLHSLPIEAPDKLHQAHAGLVGLFGMGFVFKHFVHEGQGLGTDLSGLFGKLVHRPVFDIADIRRQVFLIGGKTTRLGGALVKGDALVVVVHFNGGAIGPDLNAFAFVLMRKRCSSVCPHRTTHGILY